MAPPSPRSDCSFGAENPSRGAVSFELTLTPEQLDMVAQRVAAILDVRAQPALSTWVDSTGAAEHLCCSKDRIHDLVSLGRLEPHRDGTRLLFRRDELDAYLGRSA